MLSFLQFIKETMSVGDSHHAEIYFWDDGEAPSLYRLIRTGTQTISEGGKAYHPGEKDVLDGKLHKTIGKFTPSSYDHDTIAKEFHHHLYKHGYYMHTNSHPLVMSPKDQKFKSEFKKQIARTSRGKEVSEHELPHHDGSPARAAKPGQHTMGRYVGLWSTRGSTNVYDKSAKDRSAKPIKGATKDRHISIINDKEVKHAASGVTNRWFLRAGEIRKIPKSGLVSPSGKKYGDDIHSYVADKKHNEPKHHRNVRDYFNEKNTTASQEDKDKTLRWIKKNHPDFHPDKLKPGRFVK